MDQRTVIVTGAGSGIGRATASRFAASGANVACLDVGDTSSIVDEIGNAGGTALALTVDVAVRSHWQDAVTQILETFGTIDVLTNVAGVMGRATDSAVDQSDDEWDRIIDINLRGTWLGMQAVLPTMIAQGRGAIINIASGVAFIGLPGAFAYTASKGAVVALTRQASVDYARNGVRVNAVAPGWTDTPLARAGTDPDVIKGLERSVPAGRAARPEDIAGAVFFLASSDADYVHGQTYLVDGGFSAGRV